MANGSKSGMSDDSGSSNVMSNPFPALSPEECVKLVKEMKDTNVSKNFFEVRIAQLEKTNPRGHYMAVQEGLI